MRNLTQNLMFICLSLLIGQSNSFSQTTLQSWSLDAVSVAMPASTTFSITGGSTAADAGVLTSGSVISAFHTSPATLWTTPSGNGGGKSISADHWASGDYFQVSGNAFDYQGISVSWDQTGSGTGPRDFKVQYSINGTSFMDAPSGNYALTNDGWGATYKPASVRTIDLSTVTALDNQPSIFIRFVVTSTTNINGTTIATGGTGRIDNVIISAATALPIGLKSFIGNIQGSSSLLSWQTATELNNSHFVIERSADARNFTEIGQVQGAGTTRIPQSYTFTDEKPLTGVNYYRLRQVDFDGVESFSPVVSVVFGKTGHISIAPSPATDRVRIQLEESYDNDGLWQVYDNTGRQVLSGAWEAESTDYELNVNTLPEGMYTFRLVVGTQVQVKQFRKM